MEIGEFESANPDLGVRCTDYAEWVRQQLGRGEIWGFFDGENPGTETGELAGGHDFLVVDVRWIVDLWPKFVACISERAVFDLESAADQPEIARLFGRLENWSIVS